MGKSKKMSFTSIAIVVLAILLTVSLTMGGTLAWFANQNQAGTTLTMGNAVGVAVVDKAGTNGSMDRLSFQFNTGRNGELMLPGTQIDPDVRAMIARSNTNVILRAVVTFEVTLDKNLSETNKAAVATAAGAELGTDGFMVVPSSVAASLGGVTTLPSKDQPVQRELFLLNKLYTSFFSTLQRSALYNGWVYRESNIGAAGKVFEGASAKAASTNYYVAGKTQYSNTPIIVGRDAGLNRTQAQNTGDVAEGNAVSYNAFYFRGWQTTDTIAAPSVDGLPSDPADWQYEAVNRGIDGWYEIARSNGSIVRERYVGGGRMYHATRAEAAAAASITDAKEYAIMEGTLNPADGSFTRTPDPLGYRKGDYTAATTANMNAEESVDSLSVINRSTAQINTNGSGNTNTLPTDNTRDSWQYSGVQSANEDLMCVLNTNTSTVKVPLFTTSFILPTDWTQDAFADRSMRLNITFQVMQADYLASGTSHHCSVELAESRFDDVTIWYNGTQTAPDSGHTVSIGQPYIKNVADQPDFDNPAFWNGAYGQPSTPVTPPETPVTPS